MKKTVALILPTYKPGGELKLLLTRMEKQDYPLKEIILINTEAEHFREELLQDLGQEFRNKITIIHIEKSQFDHGATRNLGAGMAEADLLLFMTQDAIPKDRHLVSALVNAFEEERTAVAYARQLPRKSCDVIEQYTRSFNYPSEDVVKDLSTLTRYGIKNYFCSDVCAMYRRELFMELNGFENKVLFSEDMMYASKAMKTGRQVHYVANARVVHSHNYSCVQQFKRNFDNGATQSMHPEVFQGIPSEGEGARMVMETARFLVKHNQAYKLPELVIKSGCKYAGFRLGKAYRLLPEKYIKQMTSNPGFWEKNENMEESEC